jgi:ectoine hydroxylase-related dioxygenase (phytanoyl-CoA dioxygenase family)
VASYGHVKPAHTSAHTGVHSDVAHLRGVPHHASTLMVKVMYALTKVGPQSGATLIYPGTHRLPAAEQADPEGMDGIHILLEPGDVQIFHANLLHTATANPTDQARLSVWFVYAQPWMRAFPGHEHTSEFLDALSPRIESEPALATVFGLPNPYATRR